MRKVISLSILAVMFSLFTHSAFAEREGCEVLKDGGYTKGLYGLCIAYWSATNSNARDRILENFYKKAEPGEEMPGLGSSVDCPCWTADKLAEASVYGTPVACQINEDRMGLEFAVYGADSYNFLIEDALCFQRNPDGSGPYNTFNEETTDEEIQACRDGLKALVDLDFGGTCP